MDGIDERVKLAADQLNTGNTAAAEKIARDLLAAAPRNINALRLMGAITRKQGQLERSLEYFQEALRLNDQKGLLHFELGTAYTELQRSEEAFECYYKAVQLDPTLQPAYVNLSALMEQHERYEEAIEWAEKAIALKPDCGLSHYNLANAQRELGRLSDAIASYEKSRGLKPDHAKTHWNMGICHLLAGNFREGWRLFECRQEAQEVFFDRYPQPRWNGSSLADKTIVVHAEQGIGDEVLFASCFPDLVPLAKRCILVCDPRLERLLARSFPQAVVYTHLRRKDWSPPVLPEQIDVQIPAGSLPFFFRSAPGSFPRRDRFFAVDPQLLATWRKRLAAIGPGLKIGISWRAGGKRLESRKRTIPLDDWAKIFAIPGTQFVNLQYGDAGAEMAAARAKFGIEIHDWEEGDPLIDIDGFAAKIAALDLVISVGNATVHIAGAVGTPSWTLLPMVPSWRWMIAGEESPWYGQVRLFRQPTPGDWGPVLDRITRMLRERVGAAGYASASAASAAATKSTGLIRSSQSERANRWFGPADLAGHKTDQLVRELLEEAGRHEAANELAQAETKYREVLQLAPRHFAALNGLGIVARKTGRTELAIRSFRRSLAMVDALPIHQLNLADSLADAGRWDEALDCHRRALELDPAHVAAQVQAGRMLQRLQRHGEAIEHFQKALAITPHDENALAELGRSLTLSCRIDEAIAHLEQAVQLRPDSAALQVALGSAYGGDQRYAEAELCFRCATEIEPAHAMAHFLLAQVLQSLDKSLEATDRYEQVLELDEGYTSALAPLAMLRRQLGQLEAAASLFRRALALRPADPQVLNSLGVVLSEQCAAEDALDCFGDAIQFAPAYAEAHVNRAFALLRMGRLAEGWPEYEWRWKCPDSGRSPAGFKQPVWDGTSLAAMMILVHGEQGLADEIMFASCYPDLMERAAGCVIACDPRLESLLRRSFSPSRVCPVNRSREQQWQPPAGVKFDVQIPSGSLPLHLRPTLNSFPSREPYLIADPSTVASRREWLDSLGDGLKIGVGLSAAASNKHEPQQPLSRSQFSSLESLTGAKFIHLSEGSNATASLKAAADSGLLIRRWPTEPSQHDIDELAARIAALDLLICDGGLIAHLAGALGVPTWVVLGINAEWHWLGSADKTVWYPTVRLFRQVQPDDWSIPIERLRQELLNSTGPAADHKRMRTISGPHWSFRRATT
ncbi:MAG TPA: tetratricopeptide repeat protein [Pirellulales bacterium]|jgi:tetratricopeptide (TPR) repeat protein/ADP-heptose:LPS heptosyltransferase|nr:tetratricopeptide repeat protein [Pirellulales bacterium]